MTGCISRTDRPPPNESKLKKVLQKETPLYVTSRANKHKQTHKKHRAVKEKKVETRIATNQPKTKTNKTTGCDSPMPPGLAPFGPMKTLGGGVRSPSDGWMDGSEHRTDRWRVAVFD